MTYRKRIAMYVNESENDKIMLLITDFYIIKLTELNDYGYGTLIIRLFKGKAVKIVLQPVTKLDNDTICHLAKDVSKEFENKATVSVGAALDPHSEPQFQFAFNNQRNQWDSFKILEWILDNFNPTSGKKILGIFDVDAYSDGFDFVFGEAFYKGRVTAVYLSRLKQEFYGLKPNRTLFYERLVKEAVHELGHVFGFGHCKNSRCVMHFSTSLLDVDTKARSFCPSCGRKYFKLD